MLYNILNIGILIHEKLKHVLLFLFPPWPFCFYGNEWVISGRILNIDIDKCPQSTGNTDTSISFTNKTTPQHLFFERLTKHNVSTRNTDVNMHVHD